MQDPQAKSLVVGVSARTLFDLGDDAGGAHPRGSEVLGAGRALPIVQALQRIGERGARRFELVVLSRSNADASPALFKSMHEHAVHAARAAFTGGEAFAPYLEAFHVDLLLCDGEEEARAALAVGTPAALVTARLEDARQPIEQLRIAFDGDAAVFGRMPEGEDGAEEIRPPSVEKPLARLMNALAELQLADPDKALVRTALVTRRAGPDQERAMQALREWKVRLDQAFFVGDLPREELLVACRAHLLFDDGGSHFRIPDAIAEADLRATVDEVSTTSVSPFARLRLRSSD